MHIVLKETGDGSLSPLYMNYRISTLVLQGVSISSGWLWQVDIFVQRQFSDGL